MSNDIFVLCLNLQGTNKKIKKPFSKMPKGWKKSRLPRQNDFRTFCMSKKAVKIYHKLEEVVGI
jgi:hypothetical protein